MSVLVCGWAVLAAIFTAVTLWRLGAGRGAWKVSPRSLVPSGSLALPRPNGTQAGAAWPFVRVAAKHAASRPSTSRCDAGRDDRSRVGGPAGGGSRPAPRARWRPHVLLLRPVDAPTPLELENFATAIDYPGELTHVVLSPFRPRLPSANVRWLASDPLTHNRKVGHLLYALSALPRAPGTVVLSVDADVRVDGALIRGLLEALRAGASLATAAPRPEGTSCLGGQAVRGLLVQSHHSFAALDVMSAGAKAVCGKALAFSDAALAELPALADAIGEDLELAQRLHERGLDVAIGQYPAQVPQPHRVGLRAPFDRFTRWMQVLRAHRPVLFPTVPLFFAPTPALLALAGFSGSVPAALSLALLVALRIALASHLDPRPGLRFEWLLAEVLLLGCWFEALRRGRTVSWRGRHFELTTGGKMIALAPVPSP